MIGMEADVMSGQATNVSRVPDGLFTFASGLLAYQATVRLLWLLAIHIYSASYGS